MLLIVLGFGSIAICGFIWPVANVSDIDGRCRIGLPFRVTIPLLTFDIFINVLLTGIFIYLLRPLFRFNTAGSPDALAGKGVRKLFKVPHARSNHSDTGIVNLHSFKSIQRLLWKSLAGSVLVMMPTVGNLSALIPLHGEELGWICLLICTLDGTCHLASTQWRSVGDELTVPSHMVRLCGSLVDAGVYRARRKGVDDASAGVGLCK